MSSKKGNPDKREDLMTLGIEQLALGRRYVNYQNAPLKAKEFVEFLVRLQINPVDLERFYQDDTITEETEAVDSYRKYSDYIKDVQAKYGVTLDFKIKKDSGYMGYPDRQLRICSDYCKSMHVQFSNEAFGRLYKLSIDQYDLLYRLATLKYYIKFGLKLRLSYQKIMGDPTQRIVVPLAITGYGNYISLLALDTRDNITRSFILSCITKIDSDLLKDFNQLELDYKARKKFNLVVFKETEPSAHYYREKILYKMRISNKSLHHFQHTYDYDFTVVKGGSMQSHDEPSGNESFYKIITFLATDKMEIERILFDYGCYAELLEPVDIRQELADKLSDLHEQYRA